MKLQVQRISKTFRCNGSTLPALDKISFDVAPGEFVCLLGPSGCGKSTLLSIIAGLEEAEGGSVYCNGKIVNGPDTGRIMIFQEAALFPWLDVIENIEFGLSMNGSTAEQIRKKALQYLAMVHLARFRHSAVHELSGGMKQRVALARSLACEPDVLLMDEPFGALDAQTRDLLHNELQEIWGKTNKTILFVTHNVREAVRLGDRVLVLSSRPASVKREFSVDLPRPRHMEDHSLVDISSEILMELRDEVNRALKEEVNGEG